MSVERKPLAGCPWCGSKPELFSSVYGHRQEPMRIVGYKCAHCGVARAVHINDQLEAKARKHANGLRTWEQCCMIVSEPSAREKWNARA